MSATSHQLDTAAFLIALAGGFVLVGLLADRVAEMPAAFRVPGMLWLALGGWAIGGATRRFSSRWKQLAAVIGVVVIWYVAFYALRVARPEFFVR